MPDPVDCPACRTRLDEINVSDFYAIIDPIYRDTGLSISGWRLYVRRDLSDLSSVWVEMRLDETHPAESITLDPLEWQDQLRRWQNAPRTLSGEMGWRMTVENPLHSLADPMLLIGFAWRFSDA